MHDVLIVGNGLFGSITAAVLKKRGMDVATIDDKRPKSGSSAAACLMKPAWLASLKKEDLTAALKELDALYGLRTLYFHLGPALVPLYWVPPALVLRESDYYAKATSVRPGAVECADGRTYEAKHVIVAAGIWSSNLVPTAVQVGKVGMSARLIGPPPDDRITVWAPYKQLVRFGREGFHWAGDGTALLEKSWNKEAEKKVMNRIAEGAKVGVSRWITGIRPFSPERDPFMLRELPGSVWVTSGGGKNGTAAATVAALKIAGRIA